MRTYNLKKEFLPHIAKFKYYHEDLPTEVDLRSKDNIPIFDQGNLGSCSSNAVISAFEFHNQSFSASRLFHYYCERMDDNDVNEDAGVSSIRESIIALETYGVCREDLWPYDIAKFKVKPSPICFKEALNHKVIKANHVHYDTLKACIALENPVVVGIVIYSSFESEEVAKTGIVTMPNTDETVLGGHAIMIEGFSDTSNHWICRNSWGSQWGDKGIFYLPYEYLDEQKNLASDFWCITQI